MSAQESTLASFTQPDPDAQDHPLGLVRTLERAQEFLEAGETADTKAAIQGALEKAREAESHPANKPAKIPAFMIADLLHGTDFELGRYINEGQDGNRRHAIREALLNAHALTDALSSADHDALADFTAEQLARMANTMLNGRSISKRRAPAMTSESEKQGRRARPGCAGES